MLDAVEDIDELVLTRASIFSRLGNLGVKIGCAKELSRKPDRKKSADPCKDYLCLWECLSMSIRTKSIRRNRS